MQRMRHFIRMASLSAMSGTMLYGGGCFLTTDDITMQLSKSLQSFVTGLFGTIVNGAFTAVFPS
jgi:hypothetical protein